LLRVRQRILPPKALGSRAFVARLKEDFIVSVLLPWKRRTKQSLSVTWWLHLGKRLLI
jgi:hypothetical protein